MTDADLELLVSSLDAKPAAGGWLARCPAHDDRDPSLSIAHGNNGTPIVHCHAGCSQEAVIGVLRARGLWPRHERTQRTIVASYSYKAADGSLVFEVVRYAPKDFRQRRPDGAGGWIWNLKGVARIPYRLPELLAAVAAGETVFVCEGEKDVDALARLGLAATCNAGGAGKWGKDYGVHLRGADVVILPDLDAPGRKHASEVAEALRPVTRRVRVVEASAPHKDISDWLAAGGTRDRLLALVATAPETAGPAPEDEPEPEKPPRKSQATEIVELAEGLELFHAGDEGYAVLAGADGHRETWPLRARSVRDWLTRRYYLTHKRAPGGQAVEDALRVLSGRAIFEGQERATAVRLAEHGGAIWLDLADPTWRAVRIDATGWRVVERPPVHFLRRRGMLALPEPRPGGSVAALWRFLNVAEGDARPLVHGWLAQALRPRGPYPALVFQGEQGTAKTTAARIVRNLIDPNVASARTPPRCEQDLVIAARNGWVLAFDNLSGLSDWLSDGLCRLSTGGGFGTRELYSDADEILIDVTRPVVLNGIDDIAIRGDLADRAIVVNLEPIPDERRQREADLWAAFEREWPALLGAFLDAAVVALRRLPGVSLPRLPRMADFATWATAAEPALGLAPGGFMAAYDRVRREAVEIALEGSPFGRRLVEYVEAVREWSGTATELLRALEHGQPEGVLKAKAWPKTARGASGLLRRLAPHLRAVGIEIERDREGKARERKIHIRKKAPESSASSASSASEADQAHRADDRRTQTPQADANDRPPATASSASSVCFDSEADEADGTDAENPFSPKLTGDSSEEVF